MGVLGLGRFGVSTPMGGDGGALSAGTGTGFWSHSVQEVEPR